MATLGDPHDEKDQNARPITPPMNYLLCNAPLHIPTLESIHLNSLVQLIISLYTYRDSLSEREERVCNALLHMVASDCGREVVKYLCQHGCISNLEVYRSLGISRQAVMRHLDTLENLGLLRVYATVENEVRIPTQYRSAKIRGWIGLPPKYSQQAVQRYMEFFRKENKTEFSAKLQAETVRDWAVRVEELLPVDLEGKLAPVYEAIRKTGVPSALIAQVKDRVISMRIGGGWPK